METKIRRPCQGVGITKVTNIKDSMIIITSISFLSARHVPNALLSMLGALLNTPSNPLSQCYCHPTLATRELRLREAK